ncbi:hypothetical protein SAMN05421780_10353 [Flexibacter flexilis DSM 6793]|uniref:Uncharacterized protein n=1 Tax=Flexibacter flexilis DSM 6793 TaxID=927664 RepID=A0A1I1GR92_9BACT|nr:hypothetical protein [Flexibacter flexilis]SFC13812.1 hypothetical protein SAMN05421780_10353 [Flexibacter flexilis DSM 6793]
MKQLIKQWWVIGISLGLWLSLQTTKAQTTTTINTSQTLAGTTWDVTVPALSNAPYNFIFNATSKTGNVLKPDNTLTDFTWSEDGKGNWFITIEEMVDGVKRSENFYGKITGNKGVGFYTCSTNRKAQKNLTMVKAQY